MIVCMCVFILLSHIYELDNYKTEKYTKMQIYCVTNKNND